MEEERPSIRNPSWISDLEPYLFHMKVDIKSSLAQQRRDKKNSLVLKITWSQCYVNVEIMTILCRSRSHHTLSALRYVSIGKVICLPPSARLMKISYPSRPLYHTAAAKYNHTMTHYHSQRWINTSDTIWRNNLLDLGSRLVSECIVEHVAEWSMTSQCLQRLRCNPPIGL
jgi:hypothetical protein